MLGIADCIPSGCCTEENLIGKIVTAIDSFECNFVLEIICFVIIVCDILAL